MNVELFFIQTKGDRYYLGEEVKLSLNLVNVLKKMNSNYPESSADFDMGFITRLLGGIFRKGELEKCAKLSSLKSLNRPKLTFAKGK